MQRILCLVGIVFILSLSAPTASAQQPVHSYILLGKNDKLPANLEQEVAARGGTIAYLVPEIGLAVLTSANPNFQVQTESIVDVESVAPNIKLSYKIPGFQPTALPAASPPLPDDDQFYMFQWNLDAIDAPEAWATGAQGAGVRIAIVDDGIYAQHPDLAPNLNTTLSKSFIPGDPNPFTPLGFPSHSSLVAGVAAAADNGVGIIGVAPQAEIVGVRVVTWDTSGGLLQPVGEFAWLAAGIVYAANIESDVINISLGGWVDKAGQCDDDDECADAQDVQGLIKMLDRATKYARKKGAIVIAAAGNDGIDADHNGRSVFLPAESEEVIAVSATGPVDWIHNPATNLDVFAPYSNYGESLVDFAAPGGNPTFLHQNPACVIPYGSFPVPCGFFDMVIGPTSSTIFPWTWAAGTSAAVPHVSGVATLVIGKNGGQMDPDKVEEALKNGADDLGAKGKDPFYGNGRVNAAASLAGKDKKDEKDEKEVESDQSAMSSCANAPWACFGANTTVQFLAFISNR